MYFDYTKSSCASISIGYSQKQETVFMNFYHPCNHHVPAVGASALSSSRFWKRDEINDSSTLAVLGGKHEAELDQARSGKHKSISSQRTTTKAINGFIDSI